MVLQSLKKTLNFKNGKLNIFLLSLAIIVVLYNEYFSYNFASNDWRQFNATADKLKILFVADPQIVGLDDEHWLLGYITRLDCDRFLRNGFTRAFSHTKPDVIIFLGDLFDEGSKARDVQYETYLKRFATTFYTGQDVKRIYIPGDNDIGGEGYDRLETWKVDRFQRYFPSLGDPVVAVNFLDVIRMSGYKDRLDIAILNTKETNKRSKNQIKMFISHLGVLDYYHYLKKEMKDIRPGVIVSAHEHHSSYWSCYNCWRKPTREVANLFEDDSTLLEDDLLDSSMIYQIVVPTCSYRMGVNRIGYGYMVIDKVGQMQYTVLWLPDRYSHLFTYVGYLVLLSVILTIRYLARLCC